MLKSIKDSPFSLAQKISNKECIVWLKRSNKYIVLDSKILELIKNKSSLSSKDFLVEITKSLNVSSGIAKKIDKDIVDLLIETKEIELKPFKKYTSKVKDCKLIQYYSFNDIILKICFDTMSIQNH